MKGGNRGSFSNFQKSSSVWGRGKKGSLQHKDKLQVLKSQCLPPGTTHYHPMVQWQWDPLELTLLLEAIREKGGRISFGYFKTSFCARFNEGLQCQDKMCVLLKTASANDCLLPASISRQSDPGGLDWHARQNVTVQLSRLHGSMDWWRGTCVLDSDYVSSIPNAAWVAEWPLVTFWNIPAVVYSYVRCRS